MLIIMDGWAHGRKDNTNAVYQAATPFVDSLYEKYPNAELKTYGEVAGLPESQMGNSEVGHLNLGAGRVVYQTFLKINLAIQNGELADNETLQKALTYTKENRKKLHLAGLVSEGGVHSHMDHLKALVETAENKGLENIFIHAFTDGRDTDPHSGTGYIKDLQEYIKDKSTKLASVIGRYYAMDRDRRWERTAEAYHLMVNAKGQPATDAIETVKKSYDKGVSDEFLMPIVMVDEDRKPVATIEDGDVVLFFNFRTDRCRQIVNALTQNDFTEQDMKTLDLYTVTMTRYDRTFYNVHVLFGKEDIRNTLGEVLAKNGKTQLRIAETEKYPHVTFFFSGGREQEFNGEERIVIPSPKVATYDMQPEMSAPEVTRQVIDFIEHKEPDFICLNFANPDMVAHTGDFDAAKIAVETTDECVKKVIEKAIEQDYAVLLTADHGNADFMVNKDGSPNTAHTKNPVPVFLVEKNKKRKIRGGILGDVAPTILELMGLSQPEDMICQSLIKK